MRGKETCGWGGGESNPKEEENALNHRKLRLQGALLNSHSLRSEGGSEKDVGSRKERLNPQHGTLVQSANTESGAIFQGT